MRHQGRRAEMRDGNVLEGIHGNIRIEESQVADLGQALFAVGLLAERNICSRGRSRRIRRRGTKSEPGVEARYATRIPSLTSSASR